MIQEMKTMTYKVSDIRSMIQESSNEFKAKLGPGVKSGNETNNGKAYKDAEKRAKDYDGGLADSIEVAKYDKSGDDNGTTLGHNADNVDDKYKKRIAAQAKGYTSEDEMNNGIEKLGDYSDNDDIFDEFKKSEDAEDEKELNAKKSGLAGRTYKDSTFKRGTLYENTESSFYDEEDYEGNTGTPGMVKSYDIGMEYVDSMEHEAEEHDMSLEEYLRQWWHEIGNECPWTWQELGHGHGYEGDMILRIGDVVFKDIYGQLIVDEYEPGAPAYKEDFVERLRKAQSASKQLAGLLENKSIKTAYFKKTTFLTEGHMMSRIPDEFKVDRNVFKMKDKTGNTYLLEWRNGKAEIISHNNKQGMNESINRMKQLFNYKSSDHFKGTSASDRLTESDESFKNTLDSARKIIK